MAKIHTYQHFPSRVLPKIYQTWHFGTSGNPGIECQGCQI
jgi:hypothetical protein